jgi:hypothetical protein
LKQDLTQYAEQLLLSGKTPGEVRSIMMPGHHETQFPQNLSPNTFPYQSATFAQQTETPDTYGNNSYDTNPYNSHPTNTGHNFFQPPLYPDPAMSIVNSTPVSSSQVPTTLDFYQTPNDPFQSNIAPTSFILPLDAEPSASIDNTEQGQYQITPSQVPANTISLDQTSYQSGQWAEMNQTGYYTNPEDYQGQTVDSTGAQFIGGQAFPWPPT